MAVVKWGTCKLKHDVARADARDLNAWIRRTKTPWIGNASTRHTMQLHQPGSLIKLWMRAPVLNLQDKRISCHRHADEAGSHHARTQDSSAHTGAPSAGRCRTRRTPECVVHPLTSAGASPSSLIRSPFIDRTGPPPTTPAPTQQ
jgi:hypothetical protein